MLNISKKIIRYIKGYNFFIKDYYAYKKIGSDRFSIDWRDTMKCLYEKTPNTWFDTHYIYHPAWAMRCILDYKPAFHIDISSTLHFCSNLSAFIPVKFYDYRPAILNLSNLTSDFADLNNLPFENNSVQSISCMHTIEHIGLGRYGDILDADGDLKAIEELKRVTAPNGNIIFVTPVGKPRIQFNAHRIYSFEQIQSYFGDKYVLKDFSLVTDDGKFINNANSAMVAEQSYGCGCFWFTKKV